MTLCGTDIAYRLGMTLPFSIIAQFKLYTLFYLSMLPILTFKAEVFPVNGSPTKMIPVYISKAS